MTASAPSKATHQNLPMIAETPKPPYYAVIFTSIRTTINDEITKNVTGSSNSNDKGNNSYASIGKRMMDLAAQQPGFLGVESVRENGELGITVSYWSSLEAIKNWKSNMEHQRAQKNGQQGWYLDYKTRIAKVERDYSMEESISK